MTRREHQSTGLVKASRILAPGRRGDQSAILCHLKRHRLGWTHVAMGDGYRNASDNRRKETLSQASGGPRAALNNTLRTSVGAMAGAPTRAQGERRTALVRHGAWSKGTAMKSHTSQCTCTSPFAPGCCSWGAWAASHACGKLRMACPTPKARPRRTAISRVGLMAKTAQVSLIGLNSRPTHEYHEPDSIRLRGPSPRSLLCC